MAEAGTPNALPMERPWERPWWKPVEGKYAIAFYLIIFGYIIVAAYKMGMVHEKPRVVTRGDLADGVEAAAAPPSAIEPGTVIEIREPVGTSTSSGNDVAA